MFDKKCPSCKFAFNQSIPDYQMIDLIKEAGLELTVKKNQPAETQLRPEIIHLINEGTKDQQLLGMTRLRKLLSVETNPPIQEVIDAGLVPKLVEFLDANNKNQSIQFEAAWALTNIVSGNSDQTRHCVKAGAVKKLIELIKSSNDEISEQAIWALGNIAGDCSELRDLVINNGAIEPLISVLTRENCKESLKKNGIWAISNLCRNKNPLVDLEKIKCLIPIFVNEIESNKHTSNEILIDACWALSYLTDGPNSRIAEIIKFVNLNSFVQLLSHEASRVVVPCLRIIGNIVSGDDLQTQAILDCGLLPVLSTLLSSSKDTIRKEVCWAISNITAGTKSQIQEVKEAGLFPKLIEILKVDTYSIRKEAAWAIANTICEGSSEHVSYLINLDIIPIIISLLNSADEKIVSISIESLWRIINHDKKIDLDQLADIINQHEGFNLIRDVSQKFSNPNVICYANEILDIYENNMNFNNQNED